MPWHSATLEDRDSVARIEIDLLEVLDTRVVVILSWEERLAEISWVDVSEGAV
jgi:hypothetical protein